ncbi:MAG: hypothetical protein ACSLE2_14535 [Lysobacterales bacterium]
MVIHQPEKTSRRIAVILGPGGSGRKLLDLVLPLLTRDREVEMHGVFLEEAEVRHAAELPFVQELCRVTFSVREFTSDHFERALALRMRTAQRALSVLAQRTGVAHSFRNIRGPAARLLSETARVSDIMVFEPARMIAPPAAHPLAGRRPSRRIVVAVSDLESSRMALLAAAHLAEGDARRISVVATASAAGDDLDSLLRKVLPAQPIRVRIIPDDVGLRGLVDAVRAEGAALFVTAATEVLLQPANLHFLRERLRCPICLVRQWEERENSSTY